MVETVKRNAAQAAEGNMMKSIREIQNEMSRQNDIVETTKNTDPEVCIAALRAMIDGAKQIAPRVIAGESTDTGVEWVAAKYGY